MLIGRFKAETFIEHCVCGAVVEEILVNYFTVSPNKKTKIKNEEKMTKRKFTQFLAPFFIFVLYKKVGIHIWLR
jgi:hypothetical protein